MARKHPGELSISRFSVDGVFGVIRLVEGITAGAVAAFCNGAHASTVVSLAVVFVWGGGTKEAPIGWGTGKL